MASYMLTLTIVTLAHVGSAIPVDATQDDGGRSDLAQSNAANRDPGFQKRMGVFIGWAVVALFAITAVGLVTWAIIRARKHKKEKYGSKKQQPIRMEGREIRAQGAVEHV